MILAPMYNKNKISLRELQIFQCILIEIFSYFS